MGYTKNRKLFYGFLLFEWCYIIYRFFEKKGGWLTAKDKTDLSVIGANIAKYRKEKKLTQEQLADMLYISHKTVSKWETGRTAPDVVIISDVAHLLEVSVEDLLSGTARRNKDSKLTFILNIVFFLIFLFVSFVLLYSKTNSWNVYDFKSTNKNFVVSGYVVSNNEESRIVIENFSSEKYLNILDDVESIQFEIFIKNEKVYDLILDDDTNINGDFISRTNDFSFKTDFILERVDFESMFIKLTIIQNDSRKDYVVEFSLLEN